MSSWGAINILAHPFRRKSCENKDIINFIKLVKRFKNKGLNGIELHPFKDELNKKIKKICKRIDLIWTIGSDYHHYREGIFPGTLPKPDKAMVNGLKKLNLI